MRVRLLLHSHFLHSSVLDSSILGHEIKCVFLRGKMKGIPERVALAGTLKHADYTLLLFRNTLRNVWYLLNPNQLPVIIQLC